jgi:hypothetical protein
MNAKFDEDIYAVYISGPISKRGEEKARPHFKEVQTLIEGGDGDRFAYNPMDFKERDCWEDYMRDGIAALVDSDAIVMLNGWQDSRGACLERTIAFELNIPIYYEHTKPWDSSEN